MATHPCYYLGYALGATLLTVSIFVESAPVLLGHLGLGLIVTLSAISGFMEGLAKKKSSADSSQQEQEAEKP